MPNLKLKCESSFLLWIGDHYGGSMGWDSSIGIFGLFIDQNKNYMVVPVKFFPSKNDGLNFLDVMK